MHENNFDFFWIKQDFYRTNQSNKSEDLSNTFSLLAKTIQNQRMTLNSIINRIRITESQFSTYEPCSKNVPALLYQSGHLTIKDFEEERRIYSLDFPKCEIKEEITEILFKKFPTAS